MTETELHLLKTQAKCNVMKKNDKNLSELELNSFCYKLHKKNICLRMDLVITFSILNRF
ncbi:hypothetical protein K443DRAFT_638715 [Laccaria amethystina LaAM-08-1]|uniref:Uncharacterized protein n=1 Tax=Laccaria amethystina LaAM-08-1 TaxID=1095629 RepID=A0A0C9YCC0_9AGAR|nr:hypothetical protein K443DRAFT_638715 [Laccaria amethystina LaAM-08-1]